MDKTAPVISGTKPYLSLKRICFVLALGAFSVYLTFDNHALLLSAYSLFVPPRLAQSTQHQRPAPSFDHLSTHCAHLGPIPSISYRTRLRQLAQALHSLHAGAYIAEPGPSAQYFANSLFEEDVSRLSKHPWLLVVTPDVRLGSDDVHARVMMVVPASDVAHARALLPVHLWQVTWVEWEDDGDPFDLAVRAIGRISKDRAIYVDGMMRHSVVDRLQRAAGHRASVRIAPQRIHRIRERKAREEIELLRCANEVTLLAVREVRQNAYIGIRESQVRALMLSALSAAGLESASALVLFGENTVLPNGPGTDKELTRKDLITVSCGGRLHGYWSEVTRTYALPESTIAPSHLALWAQVHLAQTLASFSALAGVRTGVVDEAARAHVRGAGFGEMVHRLGHGIGIERHESPSLRKGGDDLVQSGHVFSNAPGIYVLGEVGVRLADCFYIDDQGWSVWLTSDVGGQARSVLEP